ncbi:MAG TPA: SURF1 family cytochrome oxidase biogenesis protein, partial [Afifellaceae bacterium]|nr:SURF1 family cytochrome oxidase biogenesis protein [Afifellaceae bacterium]
KAETRPAEPVADLPAADEWPRLDIAALEFRRFRLTGRFDHGREAWVFTSLSDPQGAQGGPGYWIVTPFALQGGGTVWVNRGFAPQGRHIPAARDETPSGELQTITGLMRPDDALALFTPDDSPQTNVFYRRNVAALSAAKGVLPPVAPFSIDLATSFTPPGGLPQAGETRMRFANNHLSYALTWYGLALAAFGVFVAFAVMRLRGDGLTGPGAPS